MRLWLEARACRGISRHNKNRGAINDQDQEGESEFRV